MYTWRNICYSSVGSAVIKFKGSSIIHHLSRIRIEFMGPNSNVVNHSDSFDGVNTDHRRLPTPQDICFRPSSLHCKQFHRRTPTLP